jgi:xylan 1,4-beta-xylosidase
VDLQLSGISFPDGQASLTHYRIDADHSNSYEAWRKMGSPEPIAPEQYAKLKQAGQLAALSEPKNIEIKSGKANAKFNLPRQGVSLLVVERK